MEVKVHIPFTELVEIIKQLSPSQKARLRKELAQESNQANTTKKSRLTELLLRGPVFTEEQIQTIEETRKSINEWRTNPL
jgi:hypothetical protein